MRTSGLDANLKAATLWVVLSVDQEQAERLSTHCFPKSANVLKELDFDGLSDWQFSFDLTYLPKDDVTLLWDRNKKDFGVLYPETNIFSKILTGRAHETLTRNGEALRPGQTLRLIMGGKHGWDWEIGVGWNIVGNDPMIPLAKLNFWDVFVHLSSDIESPLNLPGFTLSSDSDDEAEVTHLLHGQYFTLRLQLRQSWLG